MLWNKKQGLPFLFIREVLTEQKWVLNLIKFAKKTIQFCNFEIELDYSISISILKINFKTLLVCHLWEYFECLSYLQYEENF